MWVQINEPSELIIINISDAFEISVSERNTDFTIDAYQVDGLEAELAIYYDAEECKAAFEALLRAIHEGRNFFKMPTMHKDDDLAYTD